MKPYCLLCIDFPFVCDGTAPPKCKGNCLAIATVDRQPTKPAKRPAKPDGSPTAIAISIERMLFNTDGCNRPRRTIASAR